LSDGTFTIDNTGYLGSNLTMAIIDVREVTILTMEAITKRPATVEAPQGDVIAVCSTTRRCAAPSGL
jgi:pyruvate/2-oxoglutarate dehydrogenase complex dihydrolipoamide acyltransferase (E2) component